jgi:hypothetical protein
MAGKVYNGWGWDMLNWVVFPVVAVCLAALALLLLLKQRRSGEVDAAG